MVIVVTAAQAILAMMTRALPLFGVPLTLASGMEPSAAGQMAAATSFGSMLFFLWGPSFVGGIAALQQIRFGILLTAGAVLLCVIPYWPIVLVAAFLLGVGYGPSAPAGSDILMRTVPPARRHVVFSVKQAGVPLGGLVAGLLLPPIGMFWGFEAALICSAALAVIAALCLGARRVNLDDPSEVRPRVSHGFGKLLAMPLEMVRLVLATSRLRLLAALGICLAVSQGIMLSFYPVLLTDGAGWSLAEAGSAFALLQGIGIAGRILMGWLADKVGSGRLMLALMCVASGVTMIAIAGCGPDTPTGVVLFLAAAAGITVISWNGIFMSELAMSAPAGMVGALTSAGTFLLFSGYVISPLIAQMTIIWSGEYASAYAFAGVVPLIAGVTALIFMRKKA